jgi:dolichol-phosphate mannosyltransferase
MNDISVILPALNEESALKQMLEDLPSKVLGLETRFYVIDGGSEDETRELVRNSGAELLRQDNGGGKGSAMREAADKINSDIYVFMDADTTYPLEELDEVVRPVKDRDVDHVIGSRFRKRENGSFMYINLFGNKVIGWFFRRLTKSNVKDFLSGYRALNSELMEELELESDGFEIETEMTFKSIWSAADIEEVDISYRPRVGESKLSFLKDGIKIPFYGLKLWLLRLSPR